MNHYSLRCELIVLEDNFFIRQQVIYRTDEHTIECAEIEESGSELTVNPGDADKPEEHRQEDRIGIPPALPVERGEFACLGVIQVFDDVPCILELISIELRQMIQNLRHPNVILLRKPLGFQHAEDTRWARIVG